MAEQQQRERLEREKQREAKKMEMEMAARRVELQMRHLELQSATERLGVVKVSQPVGGVVAKIPKFIDAKDDLDSYLQRFEKFSRSSKWKQDSWFTILSALLNNGESFGCLL